MATKRKFNVGDIVMLKSTGEVFEIKRYVSPHYVVDDGRCYTAVQLEKAGDENFKYGDRVRVIEDTGTLEVGEVGTIIAKDNDGTYLFESDTDSDGKHRGHEDGLVWGRGGKFGEHRCGWVFPYEVEKIVEEKQEEKKEEIHITRKGREVHAILKKDGKLVKRTVAKCHPDDEFDFEKGAKLAMNRLYGEEEHETLEEKMGMKPSKYRVGDMVLLKTKEELLKEFGDFWKVKPICLSPMEEFLGKPVQLESPKDQLYSMETFTTKDLMGFAISDQYINGKIVKCDEYEKGDKVLVKSEKQVDSEKLFDVFPHFVWGMRKYCDKVITLGTKMADETFLYEHYWWGKDFIVGKVVE